MPALTLQDHSKRTFSCCSYCLPFSRASAGRSRPDRPSPLEGAPPAYLAPPRPPSCLGGTSRSVRFADRSLKWHVGCHIRTRTESSRLSSPKHLDPNRNILVGAF